MLWKLQQLPPGSTILIHYDSMDRGPEPWKAIATLHDPRATDPNLFGEGETALESLYDLLKKIKVEDMDGTTRRAVSRSKNRRDQGGGVASDSDE